MGFTKIARGEILDIRYSAAQLLSPDREGFDKLARPTKDVISDDGFLYVQVRAISSRVNKNHDGWPSEELAKGYKTFEGRPIFIDHNNDDPERTRGAVIWSKLHVDDEKTAALDPYYATAPDNHKPPTWIELLLEVDAKTFPKLGRSIINGEIDSVSMGANIETSICSVCDNSAVNPQEYCAHIESKGAEFEVTAADGTKMQKKAYEDCHGITFFEISFVFDPADDTALINDTRKMAAGEGCTGCDEGCDECTPPPSKKKKHRSSAITVPEIYSLLAGAGLSAIYAAPKLQSLAQRLLTLRGPAIEQELATLLPDQTQAQTLARQIEQQMDSAGDTTFPSEWASRVAGALDGLTCPHCNAESDGQSPNCLQCGAVLPAFSQAQESNRMAALDAHFGLTELHHDLEGRGGKPEEAVDLNKDRNYEPQAEKVRAPQKVDTLRPDQICPQCGTDLEEPSDGIITCPECGFDQPPKTLHNPDLEEAQVTDLRQEDEENKPDEAVDNTGTETDKSALRPIQPVMPMAAGTAKASGAGGLITEMNWNVTARAFVEQDDTDEVLPLKRSAKKPILNTKKKGTDEPDNQKIVSDQLAPVETMNKNSDREVIKRVEEDGSGVKRTEEITKEFGPLGDDDASLDDTTTDDVAAPEADTEAVDPAPDATTDAPTDTTTTPTDSFDTTPEEDNGTTKLMAALRLAKLASEMGVISSEDELDFAATIEEESLVEISARAKMLTTVKEAGLAKAKLKPALAHRFPSLRTSSVNGSAEDLDDVPDEALYF